MYSKYPRTANVNIRVNPQIKKEAEKVLDEIGLNVSDVFNLLLNQIRLTGSIPFPLQNKETETKGETEKVKQVVEKEVIEVVAEEVKEEKQIEKVSGDAFEGYSPEEVIANMNKIIQEASNN